MTSVAIPTKPEDFEQVRLIRRWSEAPPPNAELLAFWHFWPELQNLPLPEVLTIVRQAPSYTLGVFERRTAQWWQLRAEEHGIVLEIENVAENKPA